MKTFLLTMLLSGIGLLVPNDRAQQSDALRKEFANSKALAEQGEARSQAFLGACYSMGRGVEKDDAEAVKWYRKAAEQGNADGQSFLGTCYKDGKGVEKDYVEAVKWFRKAAEQNYISAQSELGYCYTKGKAHRRIMRKP